MQVILSVDAEKHLDFWRNSGNKAVLNKISTLTDSILISPYSGIGKPEALKHELSGCWSRRINIEHRYIYKIEDNTIIILSLKGHY